MKKTRSVVIAVFPQDAWETIDETIGLDMNSHYYDPDLRDEIRRDWDKHERVYLKKVSFARVMEEVRRLAKILPGTKASFQGES